MPKLFVSDKLPNYFVEFDFSPENRNSDLLDLAVLRAFEEGKCIYFKNWLVDFDQEFFSQLALEDNRTAKKLGSRLAADGTLDLKRLEAKLAHCTKDAATIQQFQVHAERISAQVTPILNRIFKDQVYHERVLTWRMLETVQEDLHIDIYSEETTDFQIRMFVNLDIVPRIWHTSHTLEGLLQQFGHRLTDAELATLGPTALCRLLCKRVYGGLAQAGKDGQPRHTAFFLPGEVWMVDSRRISHQIFYGRRALSLDYRATPESMNDPSKHYTRSVEAYRRERSTVSTA